MNLITPVIGASVVLMSISRLVLGVLQSPLFPAGYDLLYKWFPLHERSFAFGMYLNGVAIGSLIASFLGGYISDHQGWPWVFYISGKRLHDGVMQSQNYATRQVFWAHSVSWHLHHSSRHRQSVTSASAPRKSSLSTPIAMWTRMQWSGRRCRGRKYSGRAT